MGNNSHNTVLYDTGRCCNYLFHPSRSEMEGRRCGWSRKGIGTGSNLDYNLNRDRYYLERHLSPLHNDCRIPILREQYRNKLETASLHNGMIGNRNKGILIALTIIVVAAIGMLYYFIDPNLNIFLPKCMFRTLTGHNCPGCGSQRMLHALLHGDFAAAWGYNAFLLIMLPVIVVMIYLEFRAERFPRLYSAFHSLAAVIILLSAILIWWIIRF